MIRRIDISDPDETAVPWWPNAELLKGRETIEFKPGLNVIFGPNGSGKSTILTLLARMFHCHQGDMPLVTSTSVYDAQGRPGHRGDGLRLGALPIHDGAPVLHLDPTQQVGLIGGGFDWDFGTAGIENCMAKGSAGETTLRRMGTVFAMLMGKMPVPECGWKSNHMKDQPLGQEIAAFLAGNHKGDPEKVPTFLLDEPDRSLAIPLQRMLLKRLAESAGSFQIILASHSPFALDLPGANYIELDPLYLRECREACSMTFDTWTRAALDLGVKFVKGDAPDEYRAHRRIDGKELAGDVFKDGNTWKIRVKGIAIPVPLDTRKDAGDLLLQRSVAKGYQVSVKA